MMVNSNEMIMFIECLEAAKVQRGCDLPQRIHLRRGWSAEVQKTTSHLWSFWKNSLHALDARRSSISRSSSDWHCNLTMTEITSPWMMIGEVMPFKKKNQVLEVFGLGVNVNGGRAVMRLQRRMRSVCLSSTTGWGGINMVGPWTSPGFLD